MKRKVSAVEARRNLGELLEQVYYRGDEIVIERAGKPMATLVPTDQAGRNDADRAWFIEWLRKNAEQNKDLSEADVDRIVHSEIEQVRTGKRRRAKKA